MAEKMADLRRLLNPRSLAVIGGGTWCDSVVEQARMLGFSGKIIPVHPTKQSVGGLPALPTLEECSDDIDAAFIGVNRHATLDVIARLRALGAGGAVCFASGFSEAIGEDGAAGDLQRQLIAAAGDMPVLGPNCYGFVNALDGAALWPDQHGMRRVDRGVAILTQSSNIAINLSMQARGLPIGYLVTCGNQAQTTQADLVATLLDDPRVTAIGLHVEGFGALSAWWQVANKAHERGVPVLALKVGASDQARAATMSHTASLAGSDAGADAFLRHLGFARAHDLATFLETLKMLHVLGPLEAATLSSISCSGGEASLVADMVTDMPLTFPPLTSAQKVELGEALGPMVALANPLDYHTYVWRDVPAMTAAWRPMLADHIGLTLSIVDYPRTDASDWACATDAALAVRRETGRPMAVVASLPELMPEDVAQSLIAGGVLPGNGLREVLEAAALAAHWPQPAEDAPLDAGADRAASLLDEAEAKAALAAFGLNVPRGVVADRPEAAESLPAPLAVKSVGLVHKTDAGGVRLGLTQADVPQAMREMPGTSFLIEEMVQAPIAELLVGITRDAAHGFVLTIGAGGILTEIMQDSVSLLVPASRKDIAGALERLKIAPLLAGYRGKPATDRKCIVDAVMALQDYVKTHHASVEEVEINPLICTATHAIAADALIRKDLT